MTDILERLAIHGKEMILGKNAAMKIIELQRDYESRKPNNQGE